MAVCYDDSAFITIFYGLSCLNIFLIIAWSFTYGDGNALPLPELPDSGFIPIFYGLSCFLYFS